VAIGSNDLLKDVVSALGPNERLGIDVVMRDVLIDGLYQCGHTGEHASAQSFDCDVAKETFDHVQPRGRKSRTPGENYGSPCARMNVRL